MKKSTLLSFLALVLCTAYQVRAQGPIYAWTYSAGGTWIDEPSYVAVDDSGNVYATGRFSNTVDFDPGPGVTAYTVASGYFGFYLVKLDAQGNYKWAHSLNSQNGWGYAVCVDDSNNVLVSGKFTGTGDFDFGPGTFSMSASNPSDMFVMKLRPNASLVWAKQITGPVSEAPTSIVAKSDGSMAITGGFGNVVDFDPGPAVFTMNSSNGGAFVLRLDRNGNFLWAGQYRGECKEGAFDGLGNLYITGLANSGADIDLGPGVSLLPTSSITYMGVVVKMDNAMNLTWAKPFMTTNAVYCEGLAVDRWGNVAVAGSYRGTLDLDPSAATYQITSTPNIHEDFLVKLNTNGNFRWGFTQYGSGAFVSSEDVACDSTGAFYRMGHLFGTRDFDPGPGIYNLTNAGTGENVYIAMQDSAGGLVWAATVGGISGSNQPYSLTVDGQSSLVWGGKMYYPADMDPGPGTVTVTGNVQGDIGVSKWGLCPYIGSTVSESDCDSVTVNGQTYSQSGVYTQTFQAVSGCDSILTVQVNITRSYTTLTDTACETYILNGQTFTNSGTYTQVLTNSLGCDSILTLELTINQPSSTTLQVTACNSYTFLGQTYTSSGNYTHTLTNTQGCDSLVILNLTVHPTDTGYVQAVFCTSYSLNGGTYLNPGTYVQTHSSSVGCDSVLILQLSLDTISATIQQSGNLLSAFPMGATYQWLDCNQQMAPLPGATAQTLPMASSGNYAVAVTLGLCSDTSACQQFTVGIDEGLLAQVLPFPNPSGGRFQLDLRGLQDGQTELLVTDALGRTVYHGNLDPGAVNTVDLGAVATGCYRAVIRQGQQQATFGIMVH